MMSYLYRLPEKCNLYPNKKKFNFNYLSVKKSLVYSLHFGKVAIYDKNEHGEGIFGFGEIMHNKAEKSSQLDPYKKINFLERNYFQVKVRIHSYGIEPFIDIRHLRFFPSFNSKSFQKPLNPYVFYQASGLHWEYNYLHYRFSYDFCPSLGPGYFGDRYWAFYIHVLREQWVNYFWNKKLPKENNRCASCGLKSDYPYFLEIHDTVKIDFDSEYKPVNIKDFIVLCPSCHKKEHLALRDKKKKK